VAYVISRLCRDCIDGSCVDVCPVDCIVEHRPANRESDLPRQLFIDPEQCIGCSACEPECPWEAIFDESDVPSAFASDIALNALTAERPEEFHVPIAHLRRARPSPAEVAANRERFGTTDPWRSTG
jgi:ferredoxin